MASTLGSDEPTKSTYQEIIDNARQALSALEKKAGTLSAEALEASIERLLYLRNVIAPDDLEIVPVAVAPEKTPSNESGGSIPTGDTEKNASNQSGGTFTTESTPSKKKKGATTPSVTLPETGSQAPSSGSVPPSGSR